MPARSNIGYLHVVNGNPNHLSIVNAEFLKSLATTDELECIILTFDLAFYAKAPASILESL